MKSNPAVHDPHRPDEMDLSRAHRQREDDEAADVQPRDCVLCADMEMPFPDSPPSHWKCKSKQGEVLVRSPVTGKDEAQRVWEYCVGERSRTSQGCGPAGKWFRLKPTPLDTTDAPPSPGPVVQPFSQVAGPMVAGTVKP